MSFEVYISRGQQFDQQKNFVWVEFEFVWRLKWINKEHSVISDAGKMFEKLFESGYLVKIILLFWKFVN